MPLKPRYTRGELNLLIKNGADIEAYCRNCDEGPPISKEERADLARAFSKPT
jgi:hypothetical protein